jgi:hypothetical protein
MFLLLIQEEYPNPYAAIFYPEKFTKFMDFGEVVNTNLSLVSKRAIYVLIRYKYFGKILPAKWEF